MRKVGAEVPADDNTLRRREGSVRVRSHRKADPTVRGAAVHYGAVGAIARRDAGVAGTGVPHSAVYDSGALCTFQGQACGCETSASLDVDALEDAVEAPDVEGHADIATRGKSANVTDRAPDATA